MFFQILLPLFYAVLFAWVVLRSRFFVNSGIARPYLWWAYLLKLLGGVSYGYLYTHYYHGSDSWAYVQQGKLIFDQLFSDHPSYYFRLVFGRCNYIPTDHPFYEIVLLVAHWTDAADYFILRINALICLFSWGNYYVHTVFWVFFSMVGLVAIYRVAVAHFPAYRYAAYLCLFVQPAVVFWTSGVHKDGICLLALGCYVWGCSQIIDVRRLGWSSVGMATLGLWLAAQQRPQLLAVILPATVAWYWAARQPRKTALRFGITYTGAALWAIAMSYVSLRFNVFRYLMLVQYAFVVYVSGDGDVSVPLLQPTWQSICWNTPNALYLSLALPTVHAWGRAGLHQLAALDNLLLCVLIIGAVGSLLYAPQRRILPPYWYFCIAVSVCYLLLLGLISDNMGALLRYRAVILPLFTTALVVCTPFTDAYLTAIAQRCKQIFGKYIFI